MGTEPAALSRAAHARQWSASSIRLHRYRRRERSRLRPLALRRGWAGASPRPTDPASHTFVHFSSSSTISSPIRSRFSIVQPLPAL